jgi:hypothetical protein
MKGDEGASDKHPAARQGTPPADGVLSPGPLALSSRVLGLARLGSFPEGPRNMTGTAKVGRNRVQRRSLQGVGGGWTLLAVRRWRRSLPQHGRSLSCTRAGLLWLLWLLGWPVDFTLISTSLGAKGHVHQPRDTLQHAESQCGRKH